MQFVVDDRMLAPRTDAITQYAIYDHPRDFPQHFVVRPWDIVRGRPPEPRLVRVLFEELDAARSWCAQHGCACIGRSDGADETDDEAIIEVWM